MSPAVRLVGAGSGRAGSTLLRALAGTDLAAFVTDDPAVRAEAQAAGVPTQGQLVPADLDKADAVVLYGFHDLVPASVAERHLILNFHGSLLPKYRGLHSVVWAMLNGEKEVGLSLHRVDRFVDHGPVYWQEPIQVGSRTSQQLVSMMDGLVEAQAATLVREVVQGRLAAKEQDHSRATFVGRRGPGDCRIDWTRSSAYLSNFLRALVPPYPRPFFLHGGRPIEVVEAEVWPLGYEEIPGHVLCEDGEGVLIKTGDGVLRLRRLSEGGVERPAIGYFRRMGARLV